MRIGNFETPGNVFLAPMAGVTDLPFRLICKQFEASLLYTEMINAKAVCYEDKNTFDMLLVEDEEKPVAVQIFGSEPGFMAEAARTLTELNRFEIIDINMGCPAPKVVKAGDGSALMKDPKLAYEIVNKVIEHYVYDKDFVTTQSSPIVLRKQFYNKLELNEKIEKLIDYYMATYLRSLQNGQLQNIRIPLHLRSVDYYPSAYYPG